MLTYSFENKGKESLYEYLYKQIKQDILQGKLTADEKLPSKRSLAKHLNISTITVENAYQQLIAEGYIYSIAKKGFYVSDITSFQHEFIIKKKKPSIPLMDKTNYSIDFAANSISSLSFPFTVWTKLTKETLSLNRLTILKKSPSCGLRELQEAIAQTLLEFRGMQIDPNQIIIGAGTEYLYSLLIQLFKKDKIYALEDPGYQKIRKIYQAHEVQFVPIPLNKEGISMEHLNQSNADILHISPSHHFPTGIVTPVSKRVELLNWAAKKKERYIIEDDYDSEFRFMGKPIPTMQSIDGQDKVIYINTFSKSLSATIRISYMVLPKALMEKYQNELSFYSCTVSTFEQLTLAHFIQRGYFEKHLSRMRNIYRSLRNKLIQAIENHPDAYKVQIKEENAGLHFLLKVDTNLSDEQIKVNAKEKGLHLFCLSDYYFNPPQTPTSTIIINYSALEENQIEEAVKLLYSCF